MRSADARLPGFERELTFFLHEANDRHVSEGIATAGVWEPFETEVIRRFLANPVDSPPQLFVDCGANIGWYSIVAGALGADVVAFEPMPLNAALLRRNVQANGLDANIEVHQIGLGSRAGIGALRLSESNQGDHRLIPSTVQVEPSIRNEVTVDVRTLDDVLFGRLPTVMKLDTQGSEVAILLGARETLRSSSPVIVLEFWPYGLERCGSSAEKLLALLSELIAVSHSCFEIVEWRAGLVALSFSDLLAMATTGGYSAEMKGFTNVVLVPHALVSVVGDLVLTR